MTHLHSYFVFFKYGLKELKNRLAFSLLLIFSLSLGLAVLLILSSFQEAIANYLTHQVRKIMDGDVMISSYFPFTEKQKERLDAEFLGKAQQTEQIVFPTMLQGKNKAESPKLVQVIGVDLAFPLIKEGLEPKKLSQAGIFLNQQPSIWMTVNLANSLGIKLGEKVRVGEQDFLFDQTIEEGLSSRLSFLAFLPKAYIGRNQVEKTNLIGKLSRVQYQKVFLYQDPKMIQSDFPLVVSKLKQEFQGDQKLNIRALYQVSGRIKEINDSIHSFLSLFSIVALCLSCLGTLFLYQNYIQEKKI